MMNFNIPTPILFLLILGITYPVVARLLLEFAHKQRLRIIDLGKSLLHDGKISATQKEMVHETLESNGTSAQLWCFLLIAPIAFAWLVVSRKSPEEARRDREVTALLNDERYSKMIDLDILASAAASPVAAILFVIEMAILTLAGAWIWLGMTGMRKIAVRTIEMIARKSEVREARA